MSDISPKFVTAGRAVFTISGPKGVRYTYRVKRKAATQTYRETYFVHLLGGPDNRDDYAYLGVLRPQTGEVVLTQKSRFTAKTIPVRLLRWALGLVWRGEDLPAGYSIEGQGKPLTTYESAEQGYGRDVIKYVEARLKWLSALMSSNCSPVD